MSTQIIYNQGTNGTVGGSRFAGAMTHARLFRDDLLSAFALMNTITDGELHPEALEGNPTFGVPIGATPARNEAGQPGHDFYYAVMWWVGHMTTAVDKPPISELIAQLDMG
jgi:hypothetical protein